LNLNPPHVPLPAGAADTNLWYQNKLSRSSLKGKRDFLSGVQSIEQCHPSAQAIPESTITGYSEQSSSASFNRIHEWQEVEEVQLRDYLEVILRRKWLIATVLTLVFLSTLIFSLAVTRIYEASAVVEVSQETPHVTTFQEVLGSEIQAREFYETQVELLRSKAMINRVIEELDLVAHPVIRKTVFSDGKPGYLGRIAGAVKSLVGSMFQGQPNPWWTRRLPCASR
jgi:hypothetical protein